MSEENGQPNVPTDGQTGADLSENSMEDGDDPVEETLYTSFMQALATGADASQAFNVATHSAKQVAIDHGISEPIFDKVASDLFAPYSEALSEGQSPQEALRAALQSLDQ